MMDFSHLVGIPYKKDGTDPSSGVGCYWVARHVLQKAKEVELPKKTIGWRKYGTIIGWPTETQLYDILFFSSNPEGLVDHIGIIVTPLDFIHASESMGSVVLEPIRRYNTRILSVGRLYDS